MPVPQGFQRAKLEIGGATIECAFNPESYSATKQNIWTYKPQAGNDFPKPEFGGGMPIVYRLSLLLDTTLSGASKTVKDDANAIMKAFHIDGGSPPDIQFSWGQNKLPKCVGLSVGLQFALFRPNGDPIRAFVELELAQHEATSPAGQAQNPTTRGTAGLRTHIVQDGDSLQSIAFDAYGDATRWRAIALANEIDDPLRLRRGRSLIVPKLDPLSG